MHRYTKNGRLSCLDFPNIKEALRQADRTMSNTGKQFGERWTVCKPEDGRRYAWTNQYGDRLEIGEDK